MLNKVIKISLIAITIGWSIYQFYTGRIGNGILFVLLAGLFFLSLYRHERILLAFYHMRKGRFEKAEQSLIKITQPQHLVKSQQAYYYYLIGLIRAQTQSATQAEKYFKRAIGIGLRMSTDEAMAKLNLAGIAIMKRRKREATTLLAEVKKLDKRKLLDEQVKMMQGQLKKI